MKLGYSTWGMPKLSIDQAVDHIAALGFDGIEIAVGPGWSTELSTLDKAERQRIRRLLADHGLILSAIAGHASLLEPEPDAHARNVTRLQGAIDLAVDWAQNGVPPYVNTLSGGRSADWEAQHELFAERLAEIVNYAASRGVILAMEPHVDGLVDTPEKMVQILQMVDSPHLRVNFDISHFDIWGIPTAESVAALVPYSVHTHVKDQRGRYPDYEFLIPGEGDFDYVDYLKTMQAAGYDGFINAEVSMMVQRRPNYDPLAAATLSYQTLARAFEQAGIPRG
ncbi:MAG TPA: sugar phosphate isomerase/epimerase family protein [Caldilineaceae bacterium]|nr:sugar phosphate isomerase/epimerase family protein [Caldilineaceae bacterium]